jgi:hypothetical protein
MKIAGEEVFVISPVFLGDVAAPALDACDWGRL